MSDPAVEKLRALLFGLEPYRRRTAPEPILLLLLAPYLPNRLLRQALDVARKIKDPLDRFQILKALLDRLPAAEAGAIVEQILDAAMAIGDPDLQAVALASIASKLPAPLDQSIADRALTAASPEARQQVQLAHALVPGARFDVTSARLEALRALGPTIPSDLVEIAYRALPTVDSGWQDQALSLLAATVSDDHVADFLSTQSGPVLEAIAPRLTTAQLMTIVDNDLGPTPPVDWEGSLAAVAARLTPELLQKATDLALALSDNNKRVAALTALIPRLSRAQLDDVLPIVAAFTSPQKHEGDGLDLRTTAVIALAKRLADLGDPATAMSLVAEIPYLYPQSVALSAIAPSLGLSQLEGAMRLARQMPAEPGRGVVATLAPYLLAADVDSGTAAFQELSVLIKEASWHGPALARATAAVASRLPAASIGVARAAARWVGTDPDFLLEPALLIELGRYQTGPLRRYLLREAHTAIAAVARPSQRAIILAELALLESGLSRKALIADAIATVNSIDDPIYRADLLERIGERFADSEREQFLVEALVFPLTTPRRTTGIFGQRINRLLAEAVREPLDELLGEVIHAYRRGRRTGVKGPSAAELAFYRRVDLWSRAPETVPSTPTSFDWIKDWSVMGKGSGPVHAAETSEGAAGPLRAGIDDEVVTEKVVVGDDIPQVKDSTRPERVVNTGFAAEGSPDNSIDPSQSLQTARPYWLFLDVGVAMVGSIERTPTGLPRRVPQEAQVTVALFSFPGELEIEAGTDIGELQLRADGSVAVVRQPASRAAIAGSAAKDRRLFFPVRTPDREGSLRLRCNIYYRHLLVQSRLVTARVTNDPLTGPRMLDAVVDYSLAPSLDPDQLVGISEHQLSVGMESNGTHQFQFLGAGDFKATATFDGQELESYIKAARGALRRAAWGTDQPWTPGDALRYSGAPDPDRLEGDLIAMAQAGYTFYDAIADRLAGDRKKAWQLQNLMQEPGVVQIALKQSARFILPVAMIYDSPVVLDTTAGVTVCPAFRHALERGDPLAQLACFAGECPNRGVKTIVCPSGFWGYRHWLGMPVGVKEAPDITSEISCAGGFEFTMAVATNLPGLAAHEAAMQSIRQKLGWNLATTYKDTLRLLRDAQAQVVYFYCHGGVEAGGLPFIQVGDDTDEHFSSPALREGR